MMASIRIAVWSLLLLLLLFGVLSLRWQSKAEDARPAGWYLEECAGAYHTTYRCWRWHGPAEAVVPARR